MSPQLAAFLYVLGICALIWWCAVHMPYHVRKHQGRCVDCNRVEAFCICRPDLEED